MNKKVYVSIPITGKEYADQRNHAFNAQVMLEIKGFNVVTPFDIIPNPHTPYAECMGLCIKELLKCDTIYLCKGWQESKGCQAEFQVALIYGKEIMIE